ncbi:MAG: hypothetical protein AB7O97_17680 [Planctomycetota bacterium]
MPPHKQGRRKRTPAAALPKGLRKKVVESLEEIRASIPRRFREAARTHPAESTEDEKLVLLRVTEELEGELARRGMDSKPAQRLSAEVGRLLSGVQVADGLLRDRLEGAAVCARLLELPILQPAPPRRPTKKKDRAATARLDQAAIRAVSRLTKAGPHFNPRWKVKAVVALLKSRGWDCSRQSLLNRHDDGSPRCPQFLALWQAQKAQTRPVNVQHRASVDDLEDNRGREDE